MYRGELPATGWHSHAAPALLIGLSGRFALHFAQGRTESCYSAWIDSGVEHVFDPCGEEVVTMMPAMPPATPESTRPKRRTGRWIALGVGAILTQLVSTTVVGASTALLYLDLRIRLEGLDLAWRAETHLPQ